MELIPLMEIPGVKQVRTAVTGRHTLGPLTVVGALQSLAVGVTLCSHQLSVSQCGVCVCCQGRARQLHRAGFTTLAAIAHATPRRLVTLVQHLPLRVARQIVAAAKVSGLSHCSRGQALPLLPLETTVCPHARDRQILTRTGNFLDLLARPGR